METLVINTLVKDNMVRVQVPSAFNNKQVQLIIIQSEEKEKQKPVVLTRKLNFQIDDSLEEVIPFADITDSIRYVEKIRGMQWQ